MSCRPIVLVLALAAWTLAPTTTRVRAQEESINAAAASGAAVYNITVATDASPDLTDLDHFIDSTTSRWTTPAEKVWALFYWTHILKRQVSPIVLHGFEVTDPIRNFADYGFTMCSTVSGINQSLYEALGLQHQYWDICNHTVSQVYYNGGFHVIDSSMSNLVTTDDGVTLATIQQAAAQDARLVKQHSLYSTSPNGFLTGSDTMRVLPDAVSPVDGSTINGFGDAFCETGLKLRDYYYNWNSGHRYVLNIREGESYTRYYRRLGTGVDYYVSSERVSSPDPSNTFENDAANRFGLRGNGAWTYSPSLDSSTWQVAAYSSANIAPLAGGLGPSAAGRSGELVYKVQAANAMTSQQIRATFARTDAGATAVISVSTNQGATWQDAGTIGSTVGAAVPVTVNLRSQVNSEYEALIRIRMTSPSATGIALTGLTIDTLTQVNTKALPRLNIGRNEIFVGAGDQSDTMVLYPDLRADYWKKDIYSSANIASQSVTVPRKYTAVVYPANLTAEAHLTYRMTSPTDFTRITYGGRLHNYRADSYIDFLHSFDNGATWIRSYHFTDATKPYDDIHYETVNVPAGVRIVLFRFLMHNTNTDATRATGLYSVRMEAERLPVVQAIAPIDVTLRWNEVRADRTTITRSHKQRVAQYPFKYVIDVGGSDHPVMESMTVNLSSETDASPYGYSDGRDAGGSKYLYRRQVDGTNLAVGRPYTFSRAPSAFQSSAGSSDTKILTDGVVGSPVTGSYSYWWGQCWTSGSDLDLRVDLGALKNVGAFRAHLFGYPFWDAHKGQVRDRVEVLTSTDGVTFTSRGVLDTSLWKKDVPVNYMLQDDETATGWNFELVLPAPVAARYVKYHATPMRNLCISELQVFDRVTYEPFDIRIALPDGSGTTPLPDPTNQAPTVTLSSPMIGQAFTAPASVALAATATDVDGSIARVDFLVDGSVVATDSTAPYSATWTSPGAGSFTVAARAIDNVGASSMSAAAAITVTDEDSTIQGEDIVLWAAEAPVAIGWTSTSDASAAGGHRLQNQNLGAAKITAPAAAPSKYFELTFDALAGRGYRLWMRSIAQDNSWANDSVYVQFDDSVDAAGQPTYRIGTTSGTWYSLEECTSCGVSGWGWQDNGYGSIGAPGLLIYFGITGPQRIRVQVREDGIGIDQIVLSSNRWLEVAPGAAKKDTTILPKTEPLVSNKAPAVSLTSPANGAVFTLPASIPITADASDSDGTVSRVDFYVNGSPIASDTAMPFTTTWSPSNAGSYAITASARDDDGAVATSAPAVISVTSGSSAPSDDVVLYAAEAAAPVNWSVVADTTAAGGARMQNANLGAAKLALASALPAAYFDMTFNAQKGRAYRLWIRGRASGDSWANDSVFVQFDGSVNPSGGAVYRIGTTDAANVSLEECTNCGVSGWGWQDNGWGSAGVLGPLLYFERDGVQTIRIQVREDGFGIDQVVLSSVRWVNTAPGSAKNDTTVLPKQD